MKIEILFLGKTKESYIEKGIQDYSRRLSHYTRVNLTCIKVKKQAGKTEKEIKEYESALLEGQLTPDIYRIVLDSRGKQVDSVTFAGMISKLEQQGVKKTAFIIGGPFGLAEEQVEKAGMVLSLSDMTFTHDMVRMLLLEQIYRAYTIKAGEKYHK